MIKIKKLLINNFKGIDGTVIIDFYSSENYNHILCGPNGYGKTTIFEAIELCITGRFDRVESFKNVQARNRSRNKPFFQNTDGKDVTIKLVLQKDDSEIVITKYYNDSEPQKTSSTKENIPDESHLLFATYLTELKGDIESVTIHPDFLVEQESINKLFLGNHVKADLDSIYYLFNYIQQEESIRFLKQREDEKGKSLGFLFGVEKEESKQELLKELVQNFKQQKEKIQIQINELTTIHSEGSDIEYQKLFEHKEFDFDKFEPFNDLSNATTLYSSYIKKLDNLISFKSEFIPEEYEKYKTANEINSRILPDEKLLNSLLLSNIYNPNLIAELNLRNKKITKYKKLLQLKHNELITKEQAEYIFNEAQLKAYNELEEQFKVINKDLGKIGTVISNLVEANKTVWKHYNEMLINKQLSNTHCPLCNSVFIDFEELKKSYEEQIEVLQQYNTQKLEEKEKLYQNLDFFHVIIKSTIESYFNDNPIIDSSIIELLENYPNIYMKVNEIKLKFFSIDLEFPSELFLDKIPINKNDMDTAREKLREYFNTLLTKEYRYDELKIPNTELYSEYFENDKEKLNALSIENIERKKLYLSFKKELLMNERLSFLNKRLKSICIVLEKISPISERVFQLIKDHKAEMIEKIKIPFFIYSGKILQNYQQGFGIFIDIKPTGQRNNIILKTGKDSDHDIVFHLSAGQMAVVSIAFCLSLNKVYNSNQHFKLLAIDDPIQTMDNLNVHSFIELLRNEFFDYQIILSTHDDFIARYMSYKFEKYNMKTSIQNVQDLVIQQVLK